MLPGLPEASEDGPVYDSLDEVPIEYPIAVLWPFMNWSPSTGLTFPL